MSVCVCVCMNNNLRNRKSYEETEDADNKDIGRHYFKRGQQISKNSSFFVKNS